MLPAMFPAMLPDIYPYRRNSLKNVKSTITIFLLLAVCLTFSGQGLSGAVEVGEDLIDHVNKNIETGEIFKLIEELSSAKYGGRLTGSSGYDRAAEFCAAYFKTHGVLPVFKNYMQTFPLSYTKVYESTLTIDLKNEEGKETPFKGVYFKNFFPLNFSGSGDVKAEIVFAGYGITAPEYGVDDYEGIDVKGKIVMVIRGTPKVTGDENWVEHNEHRRRTKIAWEHGAVGLLYLYNPIGNPNGVYLEGFPMVTISEEVADKIFKTRNTDSDTIKKALNKKENRSFATGVTAHLTVKSENFKSTSKNVIGYIPGSDPKLKEEFIVIGAHLDHCGQWPQLMPGANDNASGSAALLTAAGALSSFPRKPKRSLLFILFAGEEMGLLGSRYFVKNLPPAVTNIRFVINMDMVGAGPSMWVWRLKNYPDFEDVLKRVGTALEIPFQIGGNKVDKPGRDAADHAPFIKKGYPAVSVFSSGGHHHGYHSNEDTIYWVTPKITESITRIISCSAILMGNI
jgi:hypothetical protein